MYFLYRVFNADHDLLYIGTVDDEGLIHPSEDSPNPLFETWWKKEATYVTFGGRRLTRKQFEKLNPTRH